MKKAILLISPDVPDVNITPQIKKLFLIKYIEDLSNYNLKDYPLTKACICSWKFYKQNKDFFDNENFVNGSIILLYYNNEPVEVNNIFFNIVSIEKTDIIQNSLINLYNYIEIKMDYERKCDLNEKFLSIGIALSAEKDNQKLLSDILAKIKLLTKADAGSIYFIEKKDNTSKNLVFKISQNFSSKRDFTEFKMILNKGSIAGYVASTAEVLNIPNVYDIPDDSPYSFNRKYDIETNYKTKSLLTVPMVDHKNKIIGVIQLINKRNNPDCTLNTIEDIEKYVESFDKDDEHIVLSLASQAAVSLENNILYKDIENLFHSFVLASVKAIESRDPTTSGHSNRVAAYSFEIAKAINEDTSGTFSNAYFSSEKLKEIRYAGLLHDFGKVGVRESVLVKEKKLYPGHIDLIKMRFALIKKNYEMDSLIHKNPNRKKEEVDKVEKALGLVELLNEPSVSSLSKIQELKVLSQNKYINPEGKEENWLTEEEVDFLSIEKGTLTAVERNEIESHVEHTTSFLEGIPWITDLKNITKIARGHHEKLDGSGYPDGIHEDSICLQSKILAVADFFDALTSSDRPYKKAISIDVALKIMQKEVELYHLDKDIVKLFIDKKIYQQGI